METRAGGWRNGFTEMMEGCRFSAVSGAPGVGYGMGCTVGDYDNDGDLDFIRRVMMPMCCIKMMVVAVL